MSFHRAMELVSHHLLYNTEEVDLTRLVGSAIVERIEQLDVVLAATLPDTECSVDLFEEDVFAV